MEDIRIRLAPTHKLAHSEQGGMTRRAPLPARFHSIFIKSRQSANQARRRGSNAPVIGAPALDAFLDLLAVEFLFERLLGQRHDLVVRSKTKSNQLVL